MRARFVLGITLGLLCTSSCTPHLFAEEVFDLPALLADYRAYGLPEPPRDARPVKFCSRAGLSLTFGGSRLVQLGFCEKKSSVGQRVTVFAGCREASYPKTDYAIKPLRDALTEKERPWVPATTSLSQYNAPWLNAVHFHVRGRDDLAKLILHECFEVDSAENAQIPHHVWSKYARLALANAAWRYWLEELGFPDTDRAAIAKHLEAIVHRSPDFDDEDTVELRAALQLTMRSGDALAESVDALVDDLSETTELSTVQLRAINALGLDAVPVLLKHFDDRRLTRDQWQGKVRRVSEVIKEEVALLLLDPKEAEVRESWNVRHRIEPAVARTALADALRLGEEKFLLRNVIPRGDDSLNRVKLRVIAEKYPHRLPEIYNEILERRPQVESYPVIEEIIASKLPRSVKRDAFELGAMGHREHRFQALKALKEFDHERFLQILKLRMDAALRTPRGQYFECDEAAFAWLVMQTEDDEVWTSLLKALSRADAGLKIEILAQAQAEGMPTETLQRRLNLLSQFLADKSLRDPYLPKDKYDERVRTAKPGLWGYSIPREKDKFLSDYSESSIPVIEVRNAAALSMARLLKVKPLPTDGWIGSRDWSEEQWAKLRAKVKAAMEKRKQEAAANASK